MSKQWSDEFTAFSRAFSGAAVFGMPLVFTMEMWWIGKSLGILHLGIVFLVGVVANFGLTHVAGFRSDNSLITNIDETLDSLAVGITSALILLITLNQLRHTDGWDQGIGMVVLMSIPLSVGASVAREVFSGKNSKNGDDYEQSKLTAWQGVLADVGAAAIGGVFVGLSIAPTDEVKMIAAGLQGWHLLALVALSLGLSYIIVFASGFDEASPPGPFQHPLTETMLAYVIALLVAFLLLVLFERVSMDTPVVETMKLTCVLALPATIGGAGGRLVI